MFHLINWTCGPRPETWIHFTSHHQLQSPFVTRRGLECGTSRIEAVSSFGNFFFKYNTRFSYFWISVFFSFEFLIIPNLINLLFFLPLMFYFYDVFRMANLSHLTEPLLTTRNRLSRTNTNWINKSNNWKTTWRK